MTEEQKQQRIVELEAEQARLLAEIAAADRWIATLEELKRRYGVGWMHRSNRIHDRARRRSVHRHTLLVRLSCGGDSFQFGRTSDAVAPAAALGTDHPAFQVPHLGLGRVARHIDQRRMSAGIVEAVRDQVLHAKLAHVAERHRRTGRVLGCHPRTLSC
jgi:hypothetical protein